METRPLGRSGIEVSRICLGTMTFGEQNTQEEAFEQMDFALDRGVFFWDAAEMYPVAPRKETYGRTEEIIGNWFASRGKREQVVIATKVVGPSAHFTYVRDGKPRLNRGHILEAIDASLKRLQTDYIDLYQLHWPDRNTNVFGKLGYRHDPDEEMTPLEETLGALDEAVKAGKIRHAGVSNETPWGLMRYFALSDAGLGPRMVSIQNPYSLLNRTFEEGLAEIALREDCGLLAYAPIGGGTLTGKYLEGKQPEGARMTLFPQNTRYFTDAGVAATAEYVALAEKQGLKPSQMAGAFVYRQDFLTSSIVGATGIEQLKLQLEVPEIELGQEVLDGIEEIHGRYTYPCP